MSCRRSAPLPIALPAASMQPWSRTDHTGAPGRRRRVHDEGRVFERWACTHQPCLGSSLRSFGPQIPGASEDPRFWASGISLIAHAKSARAAVHMKTRMVVTTRWWFGGGADLTPMLEARRTQSDRIQSPSMKRCGRLAPRTPSPTMLGSRRGATNISTATSERNARHRRHLLRLSQPIRGGGRIGVSAFAFTQDVGRAFRDIYPELVRRNWEKPWTETEREEQLVRRGRYVEFNLLYDRGTVFGLKTGGNVDSILSSMPPVVKWP